MSYPTDDEVLEQWLNNLLEDPEFMDSLKAHQKQLDRAEHKMCPWGRCEFSIDPLTNTIIGSIGLIGCECDLLPGWDSKYYEGLPKPRWDVKPVGRHGSRVQRSRRRNKRLRESLDQIHRIMEEAESNARSDAVHD
jgi:hypothetical protein